MIPTDYLQQATCITLGIRGNLTPPNTTQNATSWPQLYMKSARRQQAAFTLDASRQAHIGRTNRMSSLCVQCGPATAHKGRHVQYGWAQWIRSICTPPTRCSGRVRLTRPVLLNRSREHVLTLVQLTGSAIEHHADPGRVQHPHRRDSQVP